jgi:DNA-binding transcriptional LysR family regulator
MAQDRDIPFGALKIFSVVAESETLTNAAKKLGITQSAVSQAITQLEDLTSTELVVRRLRPIQMTRSGQVMKTHADEMLDCSRRMLKRIAAASSGELSKLTVGAIDSFAGVAGPILIERLSEIAPQLALQTGLTMPLTEALLERNLDILISSDPLQSHPEYECHPLLRDPFVMVVAESFCDLDKPDADTLANKVPFIRYNSQTRLGMLTDLVLRRMGLELEARLEFDSTKALLQNVQAGQGWAIMTSLCVLQNPSLHKGIRILPLTNCANARYVNLLARKDELGKTPERVAKICREVYTEIMLPSILAVMPWLEGEARAVTEAPLI